MEDSINNISSKKDRTSTIFQFGIFALFVFILMIIVALTTSGSSLLSLSGYISLFGSILGILATFTSIIGIVMFFINPNKKGNALMGFIFMIIYLIIYTISMISGI